jgi:magnesium chelatase family protein
MAALVGGGLRAQPGEISLAHHGVLFLDELPEFRRETLEALRQPIESGEVAIARANYRITYPARFQLVAAMNPCRCGMATEPGFACKLQPNARCMAQYRARLSGPFLDRIDLAIEVPAVRASDLIAPTKGEASARVKHRVTAARALQNARYAEKTWVGAALNAVCPAAHIDAVMALDADGIALLRAASDSMRLSARAYHRVLKVARTIADLDGSDRVRRIHLAEALSYRPSNELEPG